DGGVDDCYEVAIYYDPMISKFAMFGRDRQEAIDRMRRALREYEITGLQTTIPFFRKVMDDTEFVEGKLDTGFIPRFFERQPEADSEDKEIMDMALIAAALNYQ